MSACHADRYEALQRVAVAGWNLMRLQSEVRYAREAEDEVSVRLLTRKKIPEAEQECFRAAMDLAALADFSD